MYFDRHEGNVKHCVIHRWTDGFTYYKILVPNPSADCPSVENTIIKRRYLPKKKKDLKHEI